MTSWFLIISILVYSQDTGAWERSYRVRDKAFATQEECEAARYTRLHGDYFDPSLLTACVEVALGQPEPDVIHRPKPTR